MTAVKVRTGTRALLRSRAMMLCVLFVLICTPFLLYFLTEWRAAEGPMRTLYAVAAAAPGCAVAAALLSMALLWWRRRQAVLIIDEQVRVPRSGVAFPVSELGTVQLWSDRSPRAYAALLPRHVRQRAQHEGVASIRPYVVEFPQGSDPQPFELAEIIAQRHPGVRIEKLGVL